MNRQWHPLFAHLLGLLIKDFYEVHTEVPVSDLPRRADLLLIHRHPGQQPNFRGLWSNLNDWNILEFKGPTDSAEEEDLELLMHVGTGVTYRLNEQRYERQEARLENRQVSLWYLAPVLGETFLGHARTRMYLEYQTGGLWRGSSWGHTIWLLAYRDAPVEADTIPLHLLDLDPAGAPAALGEVVLGTEELLQRFSKWLSTLQPELWKEIRQMASTSKRDSIIDWQAVGEFADLGEAVRLLPPEKVIQILGVERAIKAMGAEQALDGLLATVSREQLREMLRRRDKE